jgi:hypothetical protein
MPENLNWNKSKDLESEIAMLSEQIDAKRSLLEAERGIVSDHEVLKETVAENFFADTELNKSGTAEAPGLNIKPTVTKPSTSYLDSLDDEAVSQVNILVQMVSDKGIRKTVAYAVSNSPFILDAFHDLLVDKLYEELKSRKILA